jgi:lipoprotein-releasing system ATP-binding protein
VRGLRKTYESRSESLVVLRDVSFSLEAGKTVVVSGQSGCGKTTLLNLLGGLDHGSGGSIRIAGREISELAEEELGWFRNRYVGFIFQFHYLLRDFTALENVLMPARISGAVTAAVRSRACRLLDDVGLLSRAGHHPFELSGGERQRVAVARALMNDPGLVERYGKSMVLVTHQPALLERGAQRLVLESGAVRAS